MSVPSKASSCSERPASDWPTTTSPYTIGQFGSGNKHAVNVLLRAKLFPIVFCGNHKLEFTTKPGKMKALEGETDYNRVVVKHGGTDENGASVTYTEELSQTDEYGILDWNCLGMAFREFVCNAIDAAIAVNRQAGETSSGRGMASRSNWSPRRRCGPSGATPVSSSLPTTRR